MASGLGSPLAVLLTGLGWLVLSTLLGLALFLGIIRGTPLPALLRGIHVHAALVGGIVQLLIGALLMRPAASPMRHRNSWRLAFILYNTATLGLLMGFGLRDPRVIGLAGLAVAGSLLLWGGEIGTFVRSDRTEALHRFYYGFALSALAAGLAVGAAISFQLLTRWPGHVRLLHLHLTVLAFAILSFIGLVQRSLPAVLNQPTSHSWLDSTVLLILPAGTAGLITGFWLSSLHVQLAAGSLFFVGLALHTFSQLRAWLRAGQPGNNASDHLLVANVLLLLATAMGGAIAVNSLWSPPLLPYGTLHLIAYTHVAFVGVLLQGAIGGVTLLIPPWLAAQVPSQKKRGPYLAALTAIMDRWRAVQLLSLNGGTLALCLLAALTWTMPMGSTTIHALAWASVGLFVISLALFCGKVAQALSFSPGLGRTE